MYDEEPEITDEEEQELLGLLDDEEFQWPPLPPDFVSNVLARLGIPPDVFLSEDDTESDNLISLPETRSQLAEISVIRPDAPEELYQRALQAVESENYLLASERFRKAAEQGHTSAQYHLGVMYHEGEGVEQSDTEAAAWYRKAAEQGDARAQFNLGVLYYEGNVIEHSDTEAAAWWRKAAEQDDFRAQANLGFLYYIGCGVEHSTFHRIMW